MPLEGHRIAIGSAIFGGRAAILGDEPGKHFAEDGVWVLHADLLVGLLEGDRNEVQKGVDERRVHVDDVVATFHGHGVRGLDVQAGVRVGGAGVVGYIGWFGGEGIVGNGIGLAAGVVRVEGGIDRDI